MHRREKINQAYLSKNERFLVVGGIEPVVHHHAGAKLFAYGVGRQAVHVHLHVGADLLIRQELAREYLRWEGQRSGVSHLHRHRFLYTLRSSINYFALFRYIFDASSFFESHLRMPNVVTRERLRWNDAKSHTRDHVCRLTCTLHVAAMTPSTGVSEKGSNVRSDRRMKSGFSRYLNGDKIKSMKSYFSLSPNVFLIDPKGRPSCGPPPRVPLDITAVWQKAPRPPWILHILHFQH